MFFTAQQISILHQHVIKLGGLPGVRTRELLDSALGNVEFMHQFGETDVFQLSAALAFSLAKNHPFADANKRTALFAAALFLDMNGYSVDAESDVFDDLMVHMVEGSASREELASRLRRASFQRSDLSFDERTQRNTPKNIMRQSERDEFEVSVSLVE